MSSKTMCLFLQIRLVRDKQGKSRCYAFIEFEREKDMRGKYELYDEILGS